MARGCSRRAFVAHADDSGHTMRWPESGWHDTAATCNSRPTPLAAREEDAPGPGRVPALGARVAPGGRALDIGCGTGELSVHLASLGYTVDGADFAEGALERARAGHAEVAGVRRLSLDVEHGDLADLAEDGYDLIVLRLSIAFIRDRARVLRAPAARLREGGALVIITPIVENTRKSGATAPWTRRNSPRPPAGSSTSSSSTGRAWRYWSCADRPDRSARRRRDGPSPRAAGRLRCRSGGPRHVRPGPAGPLHPAWCERMPDPGSSTPVRSKTAVGRLIARRDVALRENVTHRMR